MTLNSVGSGSVTAPAKANGHERVPFMPWRAPCESNHQSMPYATRAAKDVATWSGSCQARVDSLAD